MEVQNEGQDTTETTQTDNSGAADAGTQATGTQGATDAAAGGDGGGGSGAGAANQAAAAAAAGAAQNQQWTPNFKYKFENEEREIDPFFRALIKDADSEKKVREIVQLADALPKYKEKLQGTTEWIQTTAQPALQKYEQLNEALAEMGGYLKQKDFDTFFETLKVNEEDVFRWAAKKLSLRELPQEQQDVYNENQRLKREARKAERLEAAFNQRDEIEAVQARRFHLDQGLAKPEVKNLADAVDAVLGKDAFLNRVIEIGQLAARNSGGKEDLSVDEAIARAVKQYEPFIKAANAGKASPQAATQTTPPVIPQVSGTSNVPTKRSVKSMADIEARKKELGIE